MNNFNKTIQMFIFNGDPNGRIMCELSNWNGRVYKVSRSDVFKFEERNDSHYTGVYFLIGKDDDNNETIYIGEAENIIKRLKQHFDDKNYWNDCIVIISKDNVLNKAHVKFLEYNFYSLAKSANRFLIINSNIPQCSSVSEYDNAMLEEFIENAKLLVNTLGYKAFETIEYKTNSKNEENNNIKFHIHAARGADATGIIVSDGFAVLKGSKIAHDTTPSISESIIKNREKLIKNKTISDEFIFVNDYVFSSPSLAAAVVMRRNSNGKTEWRTSEGKTLSSVEENK